jgi:hypothetical protein
MAVKRLQGKAERRIAAPREACLDLLRDPEGWPDWLSAVHDVSVYERDATGIPTRAGIHVRLLGLPVIFAAAIEFADGVTIRRIAQEPDDPERLELIVRLGGDGAATASVEAEVDVPRLLPLPTAIGDQVASRLLADLERAAAPGR